MPSDHRLPLPLILVAAADVCVGVEGVRSMVTDPSMSGVLAIGWFFIGVSLLRLDWRARWFALWFSALGLLGMVIAVPIWLWSQAIASRLAELGEGGPVTGTEPIMIGLIVVWLAFQIIVLMRPQTRALFS